MQKRYCADQEGVQCVLWHQEPVEACRYIRLQIDEEAVRGWLQEDEDRSRFDVYAQVSISTSELLPKWFVG